MIYKLEKRLFPIPKQSYRTNHINSTRISLIGNDIKRINSSSSFYHDFLESTNLNNDPHRQVIEEKINIISSSTQQIIFLNKIEKSTTNSRLNTSTTKFNFISNQDNQFSENSENNKTENKGTKDIVESENHS